jgi:hypothetical protein
MRGSGHQFARGVQVLVMALVVVPGATVSVAAAAGPSDGNIDMSGINAVAIAHGALGVYLDSAGAPVVVIPSVGMKTLTTADLAPAGVLVRVQTADVTPAMVQGLELDLAAARSKVTGDYAFYFDLRRSREVVQTQGSGREFAEISARYPGLLEVQDGATGGLSKTYDRYHDTSPFLGGGYVQNSESACSTGFEAHGGSFYYLNAAGHCFTQGRSVYSGSGAYLGYVSSRQFPTWEIEWIYGATYSPVIYNGSQGDVTSHINVYGRKWPWVGQTYCKTGQAGGRQCDWTVTSVHATYIRGNGQVTGDLVAFSGTDPIEGDSGGPIYYPYNGGALIAGTVVGHWRTQLGNTNYGTKAAESLAHWGLEVACVGTCVVQP